ncbi:laminin subunit alpha-3 isoform X2 [Dicentrarchus labrax]|uniref:laminin subunit alpha-3 isoform X2 n=1 Tax=Dicentrarchus labrax TaxID=13489 RepID=UPI0021F5B94D|nr:laminin subunit alpha-3 isoform X2 [Dicentrarchus labrax]
MQRNIYLLCTVVWLFLLCFAAVYPCTEKHSNGRHDRHSQIHKETQGTKKFCDPSFSNQTAGAITQKCSSGFYREQAGPYRGQCVPCSCNGLSNECDEHTGNCVNCQFNATGDRCERCKEGYYGNTANRACQACPCPFTWNNFALACLDIGSGVVECLCKRGYNGARCERCAFGYYGNPMVHRGSCMPCNCKDGTMNICDSQTGECITSGCSSCDDQCHECDSCNLALLVELENMDDALAWLKQQLQNIANGPGSLSRLNHLEANISETKIQSGRYSTAVRHLDPKVEQLEADVDVVRDDLSQLIDKTLDTVSHLEKVLQNVTGTKLKTEDLLSEAEVLNAAIQDLKKRLTEVKPGDSETLSENNKARMMEVAIHIVQEMRARGWSYQRDKAGSEQEEAHTLLDIIRNMTVPVETNQTVLNQTADSLMKSDSSLREVAELLSDAEDTVNRTQGLNLKSITTLQHLEHLQTQLEREQSALLPLTAMTKDLLKNITDIFLMLEEIKKEFENHAAQLDGAKLQLFEKLNNLVQIMAKMDIVTKAEEHAEELNRVAAEFQVLHNSTDLLSVLGIGAYNSIITSIEKAEMAANQSREAADQALKDLKDGGLVNRAEGLKDNSTHLWTEANETQSDLKLLLHSVNTHKDNVNKQKDKGESLTIDILIVSDEIRKITRDDTEVLIESAKTAASASNSTVSNIMERLSNVSQEVERITLTNVSVNIDDILIEAEQALKNLNTVLPVLNDTITQVEALSGKAPPSANMTESIRRIKDMIEETRNYVNKLSVATTFNGKGHVELHPPRNLEEIKAFTAVDLLLNRHQHNPSKADYRRKRRQEKRRDASFFVFFLGNKDPSGDYIGMAIRNNVLICVYKLGGVVHEVETSQITTTTNVNSSDFDRVIFHRVYQDAEVNVTQNFTSQKPIGLSPKRNLPNSLTGMLELNPDSVVIYVGGYPDNFTPPVELRYPKYRGAMQLSYLNDNPVCLFNYKHAVNMDAKQPALKIPRSEVSNYYDGTGYRMALMKEPDKIKRRLFKFYIKSRETNALLFYIGNEESFFCVLVERGFLVLQGQQTGRELRLQSAEKVSLFNKSFAIIMADTFVVHYGQKKISTDHNQTNYMSYYIGGLPALLRQRHNITAPPLRGCVDRLTVNSEIVEYNRTIGVSDGCPVSLLGVREATLYSALSVDSLFVWSEQPLRVSLAFRSTDRHGTLLRSSSQGSTSVHDLQLSLADGYAVFNSDNYTLRSDKRYNDGSWHFLSAVRNATGLELNIDNVKVVQEQSLHSRPLDQNLQRGNFTGCIANLYTRRPEESFISADLSLFSLKGDLGQCSLRPPPHNKVLPAPVTKKPQKHKPIQAPAGSQCKHRGAQRVEYQLSEEHSWLSYTLPQKDLNYRPHFSLDIKTNSSKGLILHVAGRGVVPLLALYLANGKIEMSLGGNRIIHHKQKSNDGHWHRVEFSVENSTFHLLVDGVRVTDGHLPNNEGSSLDLHNPVYLGGDPTSKTTKGHNIPMDSVLGCIRSFKMNEEVIGEPQARHKTLPCFDRLTERGTYFGGGHIILDNYLTVGSQFVLDFEVRPQHLTGLLFHVQSHKTSLRVFLLENKVGVKVNDGSGAVSVSVTPHKSFCDGKFHVVTVSKQLEVIKLVVDSMSEQKAVPFISTSYSTALATLYIGGTTKQNRVPVSSPFVGCLRNVKLNGRPVALEAGSRVVGLVINKCPAD